MAHTVVKMLARDNPAEWAESDQQIDVETYVNALIYYSGPVMHVDIAAMIYDKQHDRQCLSALATYIDTQFKRMGNKLKSISKTLDAMALDC